MRRGRRGGFWHGSGRHGWGIDALPVSPLLAGRRAIAGFASRRLELDPADADTRPTQLLACACGSDGSKARRLPATHMKAVPAILSIADRTPASFARQQVAPSEGCPHQRSAGVAPPDRRSIQGIETIDRLILGKIAVAFLAPHASAACGPSGGGNSRPASSKARASTSFQTPTRLRTTLPDDHKVGLGFNALRAASIFDSPQSPPATCR